MGFLTGAIDANTRFAEGDIRGIESRFSPENLPHNLRSSSWSSAGPSGSRPRPRRSRSHG